MADTILRKYIFGITKFNTHESLMARDFNDMKF